MPRPNRLILLAALALFACGGPGEGPPDDGGQGDAGPGDGGTSDGGTSDGGTSDGGTNDAGPGDGGTVSGAVRFVGRVDASDPNAARFAWSGSGLVATVRGSTLAVRLRVENDLWGSDVYFQPVLDGTPGSRFPVAQGTTQTVILASGLADQEHRVELYRETEGAFNSTTFLGFTSGTVVGAPAATGKRLEVVGDSISVGYGNLGTEPHPGWTANPACHETAENTSWFHSYAALAGHALGAEVSTIARSGWGLYRDANGGVDQVLPHVYSDEIGSLPSPQWGFSPAPSAVVVNLGTNDTYSSGFSGQSYTDAGIQFVQQIRSHSPDAWIFLITGSMMSGDKASAVQKAQLDIIAHFAALSPPDTRLSQVDLGSQALADGNGNPIPTGCDWHPNAAEHARMAGLLQGHLQQTLHWAGP